MFPDLRHNLKSSGSSLYKYSKSYIILKRNFAPRILITTSARECFQMVLSRFQECARLFAMIKQWSQYSKAEVANFRACSRDRGILSSRERAANPWHIHHDLLVNQGELPGLIMAPPRLPPLSSWRWRELIFSQQGFKMTLAGNAHFAHSGANVMNEDIQDWIWLSRKPCWAERRRAWSQPCNKQSSAFLYSWRSLDQMQSCSSLCKFCPLFLIFLIKTMHNVKKHE